MYSKRGRSSSFYFFPLSLIGEGDTGGEVDNRPHMSYNNVKLNQKMGVT
jgi:hypothetical protein